MDANDFAQYQQLIQNSVNANNSWSAEQAQKQMDFQERMSNTAHQREVADLKAAGLNPILAAQGAGATTPTGSAADPDRGGTTALFGLIDKLIDSQTAQANATQSIGDLAASHVLSAASSSASGIQAPNEKAKVQPLVVSAKKVQKGADRTGKNNVIIPVNSAKSVKEVSDYANSLKLKDVKGSSAPVVAALDTVSSLAPAVTSKPVAAVVKAISNAIKKVIPKQISKPLQGGLSARYGTAKASLKN